MRGPRSSRPEVGLGGGPSFKVPQEGSGLWVWVRPVAGPWQPGSANRKAEAWQPGARSSAGCGGMGSFLLSALGVLVSGPSCRGSEARVGPKAQGHRDGLPKHGGSGKAGPHAGHGEPGPAAAAAHGAQQMVCDRSHPPHVAQVLATARRLCRGWGASEGSTPALCWTASAPAGSCCQLARSCPRGSLVLPGGGVGSQLSWR